MAFFGALRRLQRAPTRNSRQYRWKTAGEHCRKQVNVKAMSTTVTEEHHKAKLLENYSVDEQFLSRLKDPLLVKTGGYINGTWTSEKHSKLVDVLNPGTGKLLGKVATQSQAEMHQAVEIAHKVFQKWKQETSTVKSKLLFEIARLHETHLDDLATIITFESGKTLLEAKGEVLYGASYFRWFSEEAKRVYGDTIPDPVRSRRIMVTKEPVGVCALISPWNFPNAMMARKIAPALAAGCSVVAKPASETPYSVLALGELFHRACVSLKLPQEYLGLVQILLTARHEAQSFSDVVMSRSEVRKLSFTGSTKVGKLLMRDASTTLKKLSLELGGNAPFIVFDTLKTGAQRTKYITDIVDAILASKFRNAGQTCVCLNRLFVQKSIKKEVLDLLQEKVSQLTVGNGLERDVNLGPLISADAVKKCRSLIHDALEQGAYVAAKGKLHSTASEDGYFLEPYVLDHCTDNMTLVEQEIFGPIVPVLEFTDEAEVLDRANNTSAGLASYFFCDDIGTLTRVREGLAYGMVGVNTGVISTEVAPFGGVKESGFGKEGSKYGLDDYMVMKYSATST